MTNLLKTFAIHTLGCKVNTYESDYIHQNLEQHGLKSVPFSDNADVYIINTCSVTNTAESKSRNYIKRARKKNPNSIVCVIGCYSQIKAQEIKKSKIADIILGQNKYDLWKFIKQFSQNPKPIIEIEKLYQRDDKKKTEFQEKIVSAFVTRTRAFIKIQEGCNNFCTFCIIPYTRGKMKSKPKELIFKEINNVVEKGCKEVVLTGIHTGGYGEDLEDYTFSNLLWDIETNCKKLQRLRISSIEITQIDDLFLKFLKNSNILVDHLHIPIQSGSERILQKMRRHYNKKEYSDTINKIREIKPLIGITTDAIVGFPTETDKEFSEYLDFVKLINFSEMHVFPYSKKDRTPAAFMEQVPEEIKKARVGKMLRLNDELAKAYIDKNMNKNLDILFENGKEVGKYVGYTTNYIKIVVSSEENLVNQIRKVKITTPHYPISEGELVNGI